MDCQRSCQSSGQCNFWTWSHQKESGVNCQFFNNTIKPADKPDSSAISGSKFCPGCWRFGKGVKIENNTDGDPVTANSITECHHICEGRNNCSLFYWNGTQCIIFKNLFVEEDEIIPEMDSIIGHSNCLSSSPGWPESIFINRTSELPNAQETKTLMFSIVGVILCLIGVSCICILILYKRNKNTKRKMKTKPNTEPNVEELELQDKSNWRVTETHNPIPIGDFVEGVKSQRFPGDTEFAKLNEVDARIIGFRETSLIGRKYTSSSEDSSLNRYGNILPYDSNRVKLLKQINGTDYINASWIQNRNLIGDMPVFIATQGPLENTTEHFLQMVIENNVKAIVMLTDLEDEVENGVGELTTIEKCARYWPESGTKEEIFGHVKVKVGETSGIPNIENAFRRSFVLEDVTSNKTYGPVVHYQFIDWPDFGVAHSTKPVVELAKTLQDYLHERPSKVIVHCSAGVGRTGSFIALYKLMFKIDTGEINNFIDIYNEVYQLREDRCKLIQKSEQYQFLHECVASYYKEKTNPSKINDADYIYTTFLASEDENK